MRSKLFKKKCLIIVFMQKTLTNKNYIKDMGRGGRDWGKEEGAAYR